jgi:short-subunit dehydrogenase
MPNAIVVGASSGLGRELALRLSQQGYRIGLVARRGDVLEDVRREMPGPSYVRAIDVTRYEEAMALFQALIEEMHGVDLVVITAGTCCSNLDLDWETEKRTIDLNVGGFVAMANVAVKHFSQRGSGHLVGISSIAALRGSGGVPAYAASKAFMSNYLDGLRQKFSKMRLPITITNVEPGLIDTGGEWGDGSFWVASTGKAASQIVSVIARRRHHAYVTRRWRAVAWLLRVMPNYVYDHYY